MGVWGQSGRMSEQDKYGEMAVGTKGLAGVDHQSLGGAAGSCTCGRGVRGILYMNLFVD